MPIKTRYLPLGGLLGVALFASLPLAEAALAPAPDTLAQVVQSRVANTLDDPLATRLDHELTQLQEMLSRRQPAMTAFHPLPAGAEQPLNTDSFTRQLTRRLAALKQLQTDTATRLTTLQPQAAGSHGLAAQIDQRFEALRQDLTRLMVDAGSVNEPPALAALQQRLHHWQQAAAQRVAVSNQPVPTIDQVSGSAAPLATDLPVVTAQARTLLPAFERLAPRDATLAAAQTDCGSQPADLQTVADTEATADIRELASKLGNAPAKLFEFVSNEVQFQPYYGALKGAQATLLSRSGGPTDQASLLISLLRASGIPSRYVRGQVVFAASDPRVLRWIGAKTIPAAASVLAAGYNGSAGGVMYNDKAIAFNHVWVEACVPYTHYRGSGADTTGKRWVPLDPSFKDLRYQQGMTVPAQFDFSGFLRRTDRLLPHEVFAQQIEKAARNIDPNASIVDVPYQGTLQKRPRDLLPASLPYSVNQYTKWENSGLPDTAV